MARVRFALRKALGFFHNSTSAHMYAQDTRRRLAGKRRGEYAGDRAYPSTNFPPMRADLSGLPSIVRYTAQSSDISRARMPGSTMSEAGML